MATFLNDINTYLPSVIRSFINVFASTSTFAGRVFWIMIGMIVFDFIILITFRLMGVNRH